MAFGQSLGPPASPKQLQELLALLNDAGHVDFRDARGPMGFTQRQAAGKFTRDEAATLIERLQEADGDGAPAPPPAPATRRTPGEQALSTVPAQALAAELDRRGWIVIAP